MFTVTIQHPHFSAVVHYFISILNNSRYIFNWLNNLMPYTMVKFDMQFHESRSTTLKSGFFDPFYNKMRPHIIYLRRETKKMIKSKLTSRMFHCGYIEITENNKFMQKYGKLQNEFETPEYNFSR